MPEVPVDFAASLGVRYLKRIPATKGSRPLSRRVLARFRGGFSPAFADFTLRYSRSLPRGEENMKLDSLALGKGRSEFGNSILWFSLREE